MISETNLLIIGAGPFGLAVAAQAAHDNIPHLIVGKPMEFWRQNMPKGMLLRSDCEWHLDPQNVHTIEAYLQSQGKTPRDVEPLSLEFYLSYVEWLQEQKDIHPVPKYVERLDHSVAEGLATAPKERGQDPLPNLKTPTGDHFVATTIDGDVIHAQHVVLAPGFRHFAHIPEELKAELPFDSFQHTSEFVNFSNARNKRYLIIGGRQSAFEWAALLLEAGASAVHISHRHASPRFAVAEWGWVKPLVDNIADDPNWFRRLSQAEKDSISHKLWAEGRLKVEPWLESRLKDERVKVWSNTELDTCSQQASGVLEVALTNGEVINVDKIILATGYKVDITRLPLLAAGNILEQLETRNGFPALDDHFETSVRGLFITSMPASQDFGPFFGFTISVRTSAKLICERLMS